MTSCSFFVKSSLRSIKQVEFNCLIHSLERGEERRLFIMSNLTLILLENKAEYLGFDDIEHLFVDCSADDDLHSHIYQSSYVLIITIIGYLLHFIINQPNKTFLDWMMACDTLLCITNIFGIGKIFTSLIEVQNVELCYFIPYFVFFNNICNRLLTVGIVIYRS